MSRISAIIIFAVVTNSPAEEFSTNTNTTFEKHAFASTLVDQLADRFYDQTLARSYPSDLSNSVLGRIGHLLLGGPSSFASAVARHVSVPSGTVWRSNPMAP